jgi:hypothetical protein
VNVERNGLACDGREFVRKAVRISTANQNHQPFLTEEAGDPLHVCCESISASILFGLLVHGFIARVGDPKVDIQVATSSYLIRHRHLVFVMQIFKEAFSRRSGQINRVCSNALGTRLVQDSSDSEGSTYMQSTALWPDMIKAIASRKDSWRWTTGRKGTCLAF